MSSPHETGVVFLSGVRTGFGTFGGALKDLSATDLGATAAGGGPAG
jgi:acetyl-CoA acetyltransferase